MHKRIHLIGVYVTDDLHLHTGTRWKFYAGYPSRKEAWALAKIALREKAWRHAKIVEVRTYSARH